MAAKNTDLFPQTTLFGGAASDDSLFTTPKVQPYQGSRLAQSLLQSTIRQTAKPLTAKQQAVLQTQQQEQYLTGLATQLRESSAWQQATPERKAQMMNTWFSTKWPQVVQQLGITDPSSAADLQTQMYTMLAQDKVVQQKLVEQSSQLDDTLKGIKANAKTVWSGVTDVAPAAFYQTRADNIAAMLAQDGKPLVLGGVPQLNFDGTPVIQHFTPEQRQQLESQMAELQQKAQEQLQEAADVQKQVDEIYQSRSVGQQVRDQRLKELQEESGEGWGTAKYYITHPTTALQVAAENAPSALATIAATAAGEALGVPVPVTLRAAGGVLTGTDAGQGAYQQVMEMDNAELQRKSAPYKELLAQGYTPEKAKSILAARAAAEATTKGVALGVALGGVGEAVPAANLVSNAIRGEAAGAARGYLSAAASGLAHAGSEFGEEYATQVLSNAGQNTATGIDGDVTRGALVQGIQGLIAATPLSVGGSVATEFNARRGNNVVNNSTEVSPEITPVPDTAADIEDSNTVTSGADTTETDSEVGADANVVSDVISQPAENTATNTEALALRQRMTELYQNAVQNTTEELTQTELNNLFDAMYQAETQTQFTPDVIESALTALQKKRKLSSDITQDLPELYSRYRDGADELVAHDVAMDAVITMQQWTAAPTTEVIDGGQTITAAIPGVDYNSTALRAALNRGLEAPAAATGEITAPAVSGDVSSTGTVVEDAGSGGAERNQTATTVSDSQTDAGVGVDTIGEPGNRRPDNPTISDASAGLSTGERNAGSETGQRTVDDRGATSTGRGTSGGDTGVATARRSQRTRVDKETEQARQFNTALSVFDEVQRRRATIAGSAVDEAERVQPDALNPVGSEITHTPTGRELTRLTQQAEQLLDNETYFSEGADLLAALEEGDFIQADTIAEGLYAEGLRQFAPPQNNSGAGAKSLRDVYMELTPAERLALQREYDTLRSELPADMANLNAWRDAMVTEQLNELAGEVSTNTVFQRLSDIARKVIQKMAQSLAGIVVAFSLSNMVQVTDVRAAQGVGEVSVITTTGNLSSSANVVNSWVRQTRDNNGQKYIIADKVAGTIHIMDAKGREIATAPALYGKRHGDNMSLGETPAGIFTLKTRPAPTSYGGDLQQFATAPNGGIYAIHRVITNNNQRRVARLNSPTASDNRISLGCINIPVNIYNKYLQKGFKGKLYVLPEQKKLSAVFPGLTEQQAQQELVSGAVLPADIGNTAAPVFTSSTAVQARQEPAGLPYGYQVTQAAQLVPQVSGTVPAEPGTSPATYLAWGAIGLGLLRWTQRNRVKAAGGVETEVVTADAGTVAPSPVPSASQRADNDAGTPSNVAALYDPNSVLNREGSAFRNRQQWYADVGWKMRTALIDSQTPFLRWLTVNAKQSVPGKEFDDIPVWQELKLLPGKKAQLEGQIRRSIIDPLEQHFAAVARRRGQPVTTVASQMATWVTMQHIPEANAALRENLVREVDETLLLQPAAHDEAKAALARFDAAQAGRGRAPMAGGLTDTEAMSRARYIEQLGYTPEELQRAQQMIVDGFNSLTKQRVDAGVLSQEEVAAWEAKGFKNFVSLYVDHSKDGDVFLGTSVFSPRGDYTRKGSLTPANNAYATLIEYANRTAAGIAANPFKVELNKLAKQEVPGLYRGSSYTAPDAPGIYYSTTESTPNGETVRRRYKLWFEDDDIMQALTSLSTNTNPVADGLRRATRGLFSLVTRFDLSFSPSNAVKDVQERAANLFARDIFDAAGNQVDRKTIVKQMLAHAANPVLLRQVHRYLTTQDTNGFYARYAGELTEIGGVSTITQMLGKDNKAIKQSLKRQTTFRRKYAAALDALTRYHETFNMVSAVAGYAALRENGVPARDAAFRILDLMNLRQQGKVTPALTTFLPFVNPAFQSGYNMARTLRTKQGRYMLAGMVVAGTALYGLASAMAGDDPDYGNKLDALSMGEISRFIPVFSGADHYVKVPIGYGLPQVAWVSSVALDRARRGIMSFWDAASQIALAFYKNMSPADLPAYSFSSHPAAWLMAAFAPAVTQPLVEVATNLNAFGTPIEYGGAAEGTRKSEHGQTRTPEFWQDFAKGLADASKGTLDFYPEDVRHFVTGYLMGPLRAVTTYLEAEDAYKSGDHQKIQQELGPALSAIGLQKFYGNDYAAVARMYFDRRSKLMSRILELNVPLSDKRNQGVPGAKEKRVMAEMLARGASLKEAIAVKQMLETDKFLAKRNQELRQKYKVFKQQDLELDSLIPVFEQVAREREQAMREFLNQMQELQ